MKNIIISVVVLILVVLGLIWLKSAEPTEEEVEVERGVVLAEAGLHWHPELEIYVKGEKIEIPQNVGLVGVHSPIHTHEDLPVIHLEFGGQVREDDTKLGEFFKVWKKDFMEFGETLTMTVNGEINTEFENYKMKDGDKIVLRYE